VRVVASTRRLALFQALRIAVNGELDELTLLIASLAKVVVPGASWPSSAFTPWKIAS